VEFFTSSDFFNKEEKMTWPSSQWNVPKCRSLLYWNRLFWYTRAKK